MILPPVSWLTEAGGDSQVSFADLELSAGLVVADDAGVDPDWRCRRKPGGGGYSHWSRAGGAGPGPSLGDGYVGSGLDHPVNVHLLHRHGGPHDLAVLAGLGRLEDLLSTQPLGGPQD